MDDNSINENLKYNYCCQDNFNELENLKTIINSQLKNNDTLNLIIIPTLQCNFKCLYCYEDKEQGYMSDYILDQLYQAIKNYYFKYKIKSLNIDWFGGEPLLFLNKIKTIMKKINNFCEKNNIIISHGMTTNGYLLNESVFRELVNISINNFQITLDGTKKSHNFYRKHISEVDNWTVIVNNLINISKTNLNFNIAIRINYNYDILEEIDIFFDFIKNNFKNDNRFILNFNQIGKWGGKKMIYLM